MSLAAHISELQQRTGSHLPLHGNVVLGGVGNPKALRKISVEHDRPIHCEIHQGADPWILKAVEWIWRDGSILTKIRSIEKHVGQIVTAAEWWLSSQLCPKRHFFHTVVEHSPAHSHAGMSGATCQL